MKLKTILFALLIAAIGCCFTSCKKDKKTYIAILNNTTNYGVQIYWDGEPLYSENARLWPSEIYQETIYEKFHSTYMRVNKIVDLKIEWNKMAGDKTFYIKPERQQEKSYYFKYEHEYYITIYDDHFEITDIGGSK